MARQNLTAPFRFSLHYTVAGLQHVFRAYTRAFSSALDTSGWFLNHETIVTGKGFTAFSTSVIGLLKPLLGANAVIDSTVLEQRSGTLYIPVASILQGVSGTALTPSVLGTQATFTYRSTDFDPMRYVLLEQFAAVPYKTHTNSGLGVAYQNVINALLNKGFDDFGGYFVSKSDEYVGSYISTTLTTNRKVRRARGFA